MKRYYRPEDVRPEDAAQVLEFLNAARTPEEIAEAVEIRGEPDIGIRLGERLLKRRDELGGFKDLRQVRAVPLIGPERFTEIVASLSDAPLPWATEAESGELMAEIRALRREIEGLRATLAAPPRVRLRALQARPYLGQAVDLVVEVTEADGLRPRPDAPVTLAAIGGRLRTVDGTVTREGQSVTTRTDGSGMAHLRLFPALSEPLLPVQDSALRAALRLLPPEVDTPQEAVQGLQEIAKQYRWHGNPDLRRALDVYFRDYGAGLLETVNTRDYMVAWEPLEVTILAHLRDDRRPGTDSSMVDASASLTVTVRNWLGAWLEQMNVVATEESRLVQDLARAADSKMEGEVLGRVYTGIRDFLAEQRGVAGEYVGQRVAERTLREFAQTGIEKLPVEWQTAVLPALSVASATVSTGGTPLVTVLGQARTETTKEIERRIPGDLKGITDVMAELESNVRAIRTQLESKVDATVFEGFRAEVELSLRDRVTVDTFRTFETQVNTRFDTKADRVALENFTAEFGREVTTLRSTVGRIDREVIDLRNR